jgi:hypothetical protein
LGITDMSANCAGVSGARFDASSKLHPRHMSFPPRRPPRPPLRFSIFDCIGAG